MEAPKRSTNVFELRQQIAELTARVEALTRERDAARREAELLKPAENELALFAPAGLLESELGAARKLVYLVAHTAARETEGYACFSDRELGTRTGVDRTSARDVREALVDEGLIEVVDCTPSTGVRKLYVRKAADAWERIKRRPVSASPQQTLWPQDNVGGDYPECLVTAQPVEGVASPQFPQGKTEGRMAPVAPSESAGAADGPPRSLSLVEEARRLAALKGGGGGFTEEKPPPTEQVGGQVGVLPPWVKPPPTERPSGQVGVLPRKNPHPPAAGSGPEHGAGYSPAGARDTFSKQDVASKSVPSAHFSESVQCESVSVRSALDSPARAPGAPRNGPLAQTIGAFVGGLLDPREQSARAAETSRLMAELIRLGGVCKDGGRLNPYAARKIATAVVAGWLDWEDVVLRLLDAGAAKSLADPVRTPAPWVYLVGTMPKVFAERERCWAPSKPKPKPR